MRDSKRLLAAAVATALGMPIAAHATNGMNLEGYGPVAAGMGGASMAYDNGTAAVMNNPATLGLMEEGHRLDIAVGELAPDVKASHPMSPESWSSDGDSYFMPAVGWARKVDKFTYGFGLFAQGGMGTEFGSGGPGATFASYGNMNPDMPMGYTGAGTLDNPAVQQAIGSSEERSEVGVARAIIPFAAEVNDQVTVGGSLDWVRATMDVKMVMSGAAFSNLVAGDNVSGSMFDALGQAFQNQVLSEVYATSLEFSDNNDYSGEAKGDGFAGKLGATFKVNQQLTIGATYHSETSLSDLSGSAKMQMAVEGGTNVAFLNPALTPGDDAIMTVSGKVKVRDFQWPSTYAIGAAFQANEKLMLVADIKQINWSEVMKDFKVSFSADNAASNGSFAGTSINIDMPQNWDDQTVIQLGGAYQINDMWTVRAGYNGSSNPVPNETLNYLFPAIIENHYTAGFGYTFNDTSSVDFSMAYAPEVTATGSGADNQGLKVSHSQTNWQLMYSHRF